VESSVWHCLGGRARAQNNGPEESITMKTLVKKFVRDESGATAIEYALIAAGIGIAIIAAVNALGTAISDKFNTITSSLK
jgi:pilus assembly protein Flp/PilA